MPGLVPSQRLAPLYTGILIARPVSAALWRDYALLANWLRGKGTCLVSAAVPDQTIGTTGTYRFRAKTRNTAIERIWVLTIRTTEITPVSVTVRAPASTGTTVVYPVAPGTTARVPIVYREVLGSVSSTEQDLSIDINPDSKNVVIEGIACYEQDRGVLLSNSTDYAADQNTIAARQPIRYTANESFRGVLDAMVNADARRVGIFHHAIDTATTYSRADASYADLFELGAPVLTRKLNRSAITGSVKWSVYGRVTGGTGLVRLTTSNSGVSDVMSITSTTSPGSWQTARAVSIDCDDMNSTDGRQTAASPDWDDLQIELQGPGGGNTLHISSISVWDDST